MQLRCGLTKYLKEGEMLARLVATDSLLLSYLLLYYANSMDPDQTAPKGAG